MPDLSFTNLPLVLALIVPGFVWWWVHRFLQVSRREPSPTWLGMFTLSAINFALWSWMIPGLWAATVLAIRAAEQDATVEGDGGVRVGVTVVLGWLCVTLLSPALLGFGTGLALRSGRWRGFLIETLRLNIPHPVDSAWDYAFGETEPLWTIVTLHDGSVVEGIFGPKSLAASNPDRRDLYLERYLEYKDGRLIPIEHDAGILILAGTIKTISFTRLQPKNMEVP